MWAKFISAWLCCATACADVEVCVEVGATDEVASLVPELLHAPRAATVANAANPVTTVCVFFTNILSSGSSISLPFPGRPVVDVL